MQAKVVRLCFDAARGTHEARVDIERDGRTFCYPCRVEAPGSAPREWVEDAVTRQALRMTTSDRPARAPAAKTGLLGGFLEALTRAFTSDPAASRIPVRTTDPIRPRARLY